MQRYSLWTLIKFHWVETLLGALLASGLLAGLVSFWLLPIAASLLLAIPLSALSALNIAKLAPRSLAINSPYTLREPAIVKSAKAARADFKANLKIGFPAE